MVLEPEAAEEPDPFLRWIRTGVTVTAALGVSGILLGLFCILQGKTGVKARKRS